MAQEVVETSDTPTWDTLPPMVQNNLARQHWEGGIKSRSLPQAKLQRSIALDPSNKVVSDINRKLKTNAVNRRKVKLHRDFVACQKEEIVLLAELEDAKQARKDTRDECKHVETVKRLEKALDASEWKRYGQVTKILGPLTQEELTSANDEEIAEHAFAIKTAQKLAALGRL